MSTLRVALVQVGYGDEESVADRVERVSGLVREVVAEHPGLDLVVLPELWAPIGFDYSNWERDAEPIDGPWASAMAALAAEVGVTLHAGSFVERLPEAGAEAKSLANTSLVVGADGSVLATYRKIHRFGFGSGEPVLMEAGRGRVVLPLRLRDGSVVKVALATCYDLRFPELFRLLLDDGAEVFVVPAAWPAPRVGHWTLLGQARAIENQAYVVGVNRVGTGDGLDYAGDSVVVDPGGAVLAAAEPFAEQVVTAEVDPARVAEVRGAFPFLRDRRTHPVR